jgi:cysteinyl-tRNA synthetase
MWLHANMLLLNGKKMSKSDGNTISPEELFTGDSPHVTKSYSPMIVRFFFMQAHYRSTLDITDDALQAAEKGYKRLMEANKILQGLVSSTPSVISDLDKDVNDLIQGAYDDMNDDFNAPKALARLFELASKINGLKGGQLSLNDISAETLDKLKKVYNDLIFNVLGLQDDSTSDNGHATLDGLMHLIIDIRQNARVTKDWTTSDKIRDTLKEVGIVLRDSNDGTDWVKE